MCIWVGLCCSLHLSRTRYINHFLIEANDHKANTLYHWNSSYTRSSSLSNSASCNQSILWNISWRQPLVLLKKPVNYQDKTHSPLWTIEPPSWLQKYNKLYSLVVPSLRLETSSCLCKKDTLDKGRPTISPKNSVVDHLSVGKPLFYFYH